MKRSMPSARRSPARLATLLVPVAALLAAGCQGGAPGGEATPGEHAVAAPVDPVAHGKYLVTIGNCADCHTPWIMGPQGPAPDPARHLSGHPADIVLEPAPIPEGWGLLMAATNTAFYGPWGMSYAANLTPDPTGLGNITEEQFVQAMRNGKHFGSGRPILPPMPWPGVGQATDQDLKAIWAYLQSIPPIENVVPEPTPPVGAPAGS